MSARKQAPAITKAMHHQLSPRRRPWMDFDGRKTIGSPACAGRQFEGIAENEKRRSNEHKSHRPHRRRRTLLRESLTRLLAQVWPELKIVASLKNGRLAVESFEALKPDICFLDVHMPGLTGIETALHRPPRACGVRDRVRSIRCAGLRPRRAGLRGQARGIGVPFERHRGTLEGSPECKTRSAGYRFVARPTHGVHLQNASPNASQMVARRGWGRRCCMVSVDEVDFLRAEDKYTGSFGTMPTARRAMDWCARLARLGLATRPLTASCKCTAPSPSTSPPCAKCSGAKTKPRAFT